MRVTDAGAILALSMALLAAPARAEAPFKPFKSVAIDHKNDAGMPMGTAFIDETGTLVTLRELADGKPIVLTPVIHRCPNICGVTLSGVAQAVMAQDYKPGEDFVFVAFGIDPKEGADAAQEDLAALRKRYPAIPPGGVHALAGPADAIAPAMDGLGYRYAWDEQIKQYAHLSATAVLTRDGRLSRWLYGIAPQPNDLRLALLEAGQGKIGTWGEQLLLLCYHYDPVTGKYGSIVTASLRTIGCLFVALAGGLIALALLRERRKAGSAGK